MGMDARGARRAGCARPVASAVAAPSAGTRRAGPPRPGAPAARRRARGRCCYSVRTARAGRRRSPRRPRRRTADPTPSTAGRGAARGRELETPNGLRTYRENIRKQFRTSIASIEAAAGGREE